MLNPFTKSNIKYCVLFHLGTFPEAESGSQKNITEPRKVPRSVSVVARPGSYLAKSDPVPVPDTVRRSYSLNWIRENLSDGEAADGKFMEIERLQRKSFYADLGLVHKLV